jgi:tetratricopeptide (TPR) repeat protein
MNPFSCRLLVILSLALSACSTVQEVQEGARQSPDEKLVARHREQAAALAAQGNLRGAAEAWKVALTINPQDPVALEESKKLSDRLNQVIADRLSRGRDALKRNLHLEARSHFLAVLAMDPGNREAFEALQIQVREVRQINHTVRAGETLASIAQLYYGDRSRSEVIWETNQLPANPKLSPGMLLKIPEIPGLPFGRPETPASSRPQPGAAPPEPAKPEPADEGLYANPALSEAKDALDRGEYASALSMVERFLGQNPRSSEAAELRRLVLFQQGKVLMEQNKLADSFVAFNQLAKLNPKDSAVSSLLGNVRARLVQQHYNQGIRLYRDEKLAAAIGEWRSVLQYEPNHEGAKRNIEQAERLIKGLQERQQKQSR